MIMKACSCYHATNPSQHQNPSGKIHLPGKCPRRSVSRRPGRLAATPRLPRRSSASSAASATTISAASGSSTAPADGDSGAVTDGFCGEHRQVDGRAQHPGQHQRAGKRRDSRGEHRGQHLPATTRARCRSPSPMVASLARVASRSAAPSATSSSMTASPSTAAATSGERRTASKAPCCSGAPASAARMSERKMVTAPASFPAAPRSAGPGRSPARSAAARSPATGPAPGRGVQRGERHDHEHAAARASAGVRWIPCPATRMRTGRTATSVPIEPGAAAEDGGGLRRGEHRLRRARRASDAAGSPAGTSVAWRRDKRRVLAGSTAMPVSCWSSGVIQMAGEHARPRA